MAYKEFFVEKNSGTYSEMLEAYGLAKLLEQIIGFGAEIRIENIGFGYRITPKKEINQEKIDNLNYFQVIPFIKKEEKDIVPNSGLGRFFNYPQQKEERDKIKKQKEEIVKDKSLNAEQKKLKFKVISDFQTSEFTKKFDAEFDVYREIIRNPYAAFLKIYENFDSNQHEFKGLISEILNFYVGEKNKGKRIIKITEKVTSQQLYSPNQGKGLNRPKADGLSMGNEDGLWISETMKISGALNSMICQNVKVGSSYDLKIFVPDFKDITLAKSDNLIREFKRYLKSSSAIKLDILNILNFTTTFIKITEGYQGKVKNTINGFHSVYQKDLGQNKAVSNIAFIETPDFVDCNDKTNAKNWLDILNEQIKTILSITEQGDAMQGLLAYRNFLGSSNLDSFFKFTNWYSVYLMQALDNEKYYVKPYKVEILNLFYEMMDKNSNPKLSDIIRNEGFLAIANAIRKSTVTLQYTPKDQRKFDVRYGLAQEIQNKSKSKSDLATFIGEFITVYNAQTARQVEKTGKALRKNVKDAELIAFYELLDNSSSSRLVGALLGSYGFALVAKEIKDDDDNLNDDETNND